MLFRGRQEQSGQNYRLERVGHPDDMHRGKVLVISTDPAHNLSDAFMQHLNGFATLVEGFNNRYTMIRVQVG